MFSNVQKVKNHCSQNLKNYNKLGEMILIRMKDRGPKFFLYVKIVLKSSRKIPSHRDKEPLVIISHVKPCLYSLLTKECHILPPTLAKFFKQK